MEAAKAAIICPRTPTRTTGIARCASTPPQSKKRRRPPPLPAPPPILDGKDAAEIGTQLLASLVDFGFALVRVSSSGITNATAGEWDELKEELQRGPVENVSFRDNDETLRQENSDPRARAADHPELRTSINVKRGGATAFKSIASEFASVRSFALAAFRSVMMGFWGSLPKSGAMPQLELGDDCDEKCVLRRSYYPVGGSAGEHTDYGYMTVQSAASCSGLQYTHDEGTTWHECKLEPNTLLIFGGAEDDAWC